MANDFRLVFIATSECPWDKPFAMEEGTSCCRYDLRGSGCSSGTPGTALTKACHIRLEQFKKWEIYACFSCSSCMQNDHRSCCIEGQMVNTYNTSRTFFSSSYAHVCTWKKLFLFFSPKHECQAGGCTSLTNTTRKLNDFFWQDDSVQNWNIFVPLPTFWSYCTILREELELYCCLQSRFFCFFRQDEIIYPSFLSRHFCDRPV